MEREQNVANSPLMKMLFAKLPQVNFYRFCQLLEQQQSDDMPLLGTTETPATDAVRFRPVTGMAFPSAEFKQAEFDRDNPNAPPTIRTTFLGLYGVDSPLPYSFLDDIIQRQEGYEALTGFLDMFNHRIMTQYYRIWLKYYYPAGFRSGGTDPVSQCLLGLAGFGVKGASEQIAAPPARFLALLGLITQRTRTAEGIKGIVSLLMPESKAWLQEFYPITIAVKPTCLKVANQLSLKRSVILGRKFKETSSTVHLIVRPADAKQAQELLPGEQTYLDLMALLRAYLGYRFDVQLTMRLPRQQLPLAQLNSRNIRLGYTSVLGVKQRDSQQIIDVNLGRYIGLAAPVM